MQSIANAIGWPGSVEELSESKQTKQLSKLQTLREEYRSRRLVRRKRIQNWASWFWTSATGQFVLDKFVKKVHTNRNIYLVLLVDLVVDLVMCILTIMSMQYGTRIQQWFLIYRPFWLWVSLVVFSCYNLASSGSRIMFTTHGRRFSVVYLIDLLTAVPMIASIFIENGQFLVVPTFLRCWVVVERLRALLDMRVDNTQVTPFDQLTMQLILIISSVAALLFTGMCAFQVSEVLFANTWYSAGASLYYIVITFSTVGYGDITPTSEVSRLIIIILIIIALAFVPRAINNIIETYRTRQDGYISYVANDNQPFVVIYVSYMRDQYMQDILETSLQALGKRKGTSQTDALQITRSRNERKHRPNTLERFADMNDLLHTNYHIVLMSAAAPSTFIRNMLRSRKYSARVTWIQGSSLEEADLKRCGLAKAAACFILADRSKLMTHNAARAEDHSNVLRVWSVKRFAPETPVFATNLRLETNVHVKPLCREVICISSLKQLILAYGAMYRGSATLITNLIHQAPLLKSYNRSWQIAYADGLCNNIIFGPFNPIFEGKYYKELAWYIYAEFQVVLIGLHLRVPVIVSKGSAPLYTYKDHYILNPGTDFILPSSNLVSRLVYIAHSAEDVADICFLTREHFDETWIKWTGLDVSFEQLYPSVENRASFLFPKNNNKDVSDAEKDESEDGIPTDRRKRSQSVGNIGTESARHGDENEIVKGNPVPPHHMVADKDLQTPLCHLLKYHEKLENALLRDATVDNENSSEPSLDLVVKDHLHVPKKCKKLENHIIICSINIELWTFLCSVRAAHLDTLKPIVILCHNLPTESEWRSISVFPYVYIMHGNPLKRKDILRAGLHAASSVVMMRQPSGCDEIKSTDERPFDSTAIMATHQIDFLANEDKHVVTELITKNNIKFMRAKSEMLDHLPKLYSHLPVDVNPLDMSTNYKKFLHLNRLPNQMNTRLDTSDPGFYAHSAIYASGRVVAGDMLDGIIFEAFRTEGIADVVKTMCGYRQDSWTSLSDHLGVTSSVLTSIPLPTQFYGQSFSSMFKYMTLKKNTIPIAIYRHRSTRSAPLPVSPHTDETVLLLGHSKSKKQIQRNRPTIPPTSPPSFKPLPLHRTTTGGSISNRHLFNMEFTSLQNVPLPFADKDESIELKEMDVNQFSATSTMGKDAYEYLNKLLQDSNTLDNDLPFLITNPLPDFILDELDHVFALCPK